MAITQQLVPGIANFYQGDTRKYKLVVRSQENQQPISVDGSRLTVTFKKLKSQTDAEADLSVILDNITDDPDDPTGEIEIVLSATDTYIEPAKYYYDFQLVSNSGEVTTLLPTENMEKRVEILEGVTREIV